MPEKKLKRFSQAKPKKKSKRKEAEVYFVYPPEDDTIEITQAGLVIINFYTGKVRLRDGAKAVSAPNLQGSLRGVGRDYVRGVRIDADKKVRVYTDVMGNKNLIPIAPSDALETELQEFRILFIRVLSANTKISVIASTSLVGFKPIKRRTPGNLASGQTSVTSAGTAVQLSSSDVPILTVVVKAKRGNTGNVFVGKSDVDSADGYILAQGDSVSINIDNLNKVYIDATNDNDGVSYLYVY